MKKGLSRRDALKSIAVLFGGTISSACGEQTENNVLNTQAGDNISLDDQEEKDKELDPSNTKKSGDSENLESEENNSDQEKEETKPEEETDNSKPEKEILIEEFDPESFGRDNIYFPYAVQCGAVKKNSALFKTYIETTDEALFKIWEKTDTQGKVINVFEKKLIKDPNSELVETKFDGLEPGKRYFYGFFKTDSSGEITARSKLGTFKTAPEDTSLEALTVHMTACNGSINKPWPALQQGSKDEHDLFLHLGDMAYNDGNTTESEFRKSWKSYLKGKGFQDSFSKAGVLATWDDHEITNDYNPETTDQNLQKVARELYFEAIALEKDPELKVWKSYRWGQTAEIIVLDCRSERKPSTRKGPDAEYISKKQMAWFKDRLKNSPCHFKVVMNSVPIASIDVINAVAEKDNWSGYKSQRNELLNFIENENIENVWFLSGDMHMCFVGLLDKSNGGILNKTYDIACTGGNVNPLGNFLTVGSNQFKWGSGIPHGTRVKFDPKSNQVNIKFITITGRVAKELNLSQN